MKWLFVVFIILLGCSSRESGIDIFPFDASRSPEEHPCQESLLDVDPWNCGRCEHSCFTENSDRCLDGRCGCGLGPPCPTHTRCWSGRCVEPDPGYPCNSTGGCNLPAESCIDNICVWLCEFDHQCADGYACVEGRCSFAHCVPEVCDGIDNDCDGIVDGTSAGPLSEFCYDDRFGSTSEELLPPCTRGVRVCSGGWTPCVGAIGPTPESGLNACDGIDNNCDGCIDGNLIDGRCVVDPPPFFDILFVIDQSGSMNDETEIVRQAVRLFSTRLADAETFRWGIVRVPSGEHGTTGGDGVPELYLNLTTFINFRDTLLLMSTGTGGVEPQWDAIYEAVTGEMGVSWREGSTRIIILFTDERGQTTRSRRGLGIDLTETDMCLALDHGEVLISVIDALYRSDFDDCAHRVINLRGGFAGSGDPCSTTSDCTEREMCDTSLCVSEAVVATANELDEIIVDPCEGI